MSVTRAQLAAKTYCKETLKSKECVLDTVYDARKPGAFVHKYVN
jgi:hypothetical protein